MNFPGYGIKRKFLPELLQNLCFLFFQIKML